jgi:hypothetical protein
MLLALLLPEQNAQLRVPPTLVRQKPVCLAVLALPQWLALVVVLLIHLYQNLLIHVRLKLV